MVVDGAPADGVLVAVVEPGPGSVVADVASSSRLATSAALKGAGRSSVTWSPTTPMPAQATPAAIEAATAQAAPSARNRRTPPIVPRRPLVGAEAIPKRGLRTSPSARRRPPRAYGDPVASVLVIEDDQRIREALAGGLSGAGHAVRTEATGGAALAAVVDWQPDVVVLDLGLPDLDGADVLRMLRGVSGVPVIVATARDDEVEIVRLLDQGADDYVVKPYSATQLEARIRAVLRRTTGGEGDDADNRRRVGGLVVHPRARTASLDGRPLELTRLEFELLAEVWRQPYGGGDKTVDVHLSWLRRKLGETAAAPRYLHTVRGVGVRLVAPAEAPDEDR